MTHPSSIDADTTALHERVRNAPQNRELIAAIDGAEPPPSPELCARVCFVLVPGIFYRDYPHTGADGAVLKRVADALAIPVITVPVDGTEGRDVAAATICRWLREETPPSRAPIVMSLSKGSAETLHALAHDADAFARVPAWVSVSGLPLGTPSLEMVMSNPLRAVFVRLMCALKRWRLDRLRDLLRYRPDSIPALPAHLQLIQLAAFPLQSHFNDRRSRRLHRQLASLGPNDGFATLAPLAELPGMLYPMWGADHYLNGRPDFDERIRNFFHFVVRLCAASVK